MRSPVASSYQVSNGRAGSGAIASAKTRAMLSAIGANDTRPRRVLDDNDKSAYRRVAVSVGRPARRRLADSVVPHNHAT
ncbi:hypothetical protein GCM10022379_06550 [Micromonospora maritima]